MKIIKWKFGFKSTIIKIKSLPAGLNSKHEEVEKRISELEEKKVNRDHAIWRIETKGWKQNKAKQNKTDSLENVGQQYIYYIMCNNIHIMGHTRRRERERDREIIQRNNGWELPKFDEDNANIHRSMNSK